MEFLGFTIDAASLTENGIQLLTKLVLAVIIFVIGRWLAKKIVRVAYNIMKRSHLEDTVSIFLSRLLYGVLLVIVILAALSKVGVQTTSVVAILGGAALAVGLALKDQLSNFAAGILIIIFRPFVRGDYVTISSYTGTVTDITLINTHITTTNNHDVIIPNGDISTSAIINYTSLPNRRVDITVGIGYDDNIKTAKEILLATAKANSLAFTDPAPIVRVTNLGDNSVDLTINVWTTNDEWWAMQCQLLEAFKEALDDNNIDIPYPQRSIHVSGLEQLANKADNTTDK
ncbi:mechanosensitive ion channel family protein [Psychrobacter lutiphocae]|uniref:mechanosensitive ion channel family protein n=1 Tax=Psychrobacter lutiphocae TaxID=540500 RepID=UPI00191831F8|nr:mechanosensitive ion channel family protein [Psychrobacter lutiphocae]